MIDPPSISFVIATYRRPILLARTIRRLRTLSGSGFNSEIIIIDNDGDSARLELQRQNLIDHDLTIIDTIENLGPCGKSLGVERATGQYILFLDDDSYPARGSIQRMLEHFDRDPQLAATGFVAVLPDGSCECSAFPNVFIGCGVGFRTEALQKSGGSGGIDPWFFMQGEEYDISFRLINAGWKVQSFDDLVVHHLKSPQSRRSSQTLRLDARNNAYLIARYLPHGLMRPYADDWSRRYLWMLASAGRARWFGRAWNEGWRRGLRIRRTDPLGVLSPRAVETLFRLEQLNDAFRELNQNGVQRVSFAGLGKNIHAFYSAARRNAIVINVVIEDRTFAGNRMYRGLPIVSTTYGLHCDADAIVIAETSPVRSRVLRRQLVGKTVLPIFDWFGDEFRTQMFSDPEQNFPQKHRSKMRRDEGHRELIEMC